MGRTRRPKTVQSYKIAVIKLIECVPAARERYITRADLIKFRDWRADTTSVSSANRDLKALKACLSWSWLNELGHPPVNLKRLLLQPPPRKDETLTPDEVERVMKASEFDVPVRIVLRICHATGFRLGEVLNLIWSDVDEISITAKPWWQPKTDAAIRTVYPPELAEWLVEYRETLRHGGAGDRVCQQHEMSGKFAQGRRGLLPTYSEKLNANDCSSPRSPTSSAEEWASERIQRPSPPCTSTQIISVPAASCFPRRRRRRTRNSARAQGESVRELA